MGLYLGWSGLGSNQITSCHSCNNSCHHNINCADGYLNCVNPLLLPILFSSGRSGQYLALYSKSVWFFLKERSNKESMEFDWVMDLIGYDMNGENSNHIFACYGTQMRPFDAISYGSQLCGTAPLMQAIDCR